VKKSYRSILSVGLLAVLAVSLTFMLTGCGFFNKAPTADIKITSGQTVTDGTVQANVDETIEFM